MSTDNAAAPDDTLVTAKQVAPWFGYEPDQYKAVYALLEREGVVPVYHGRRKRFWRSDVVRAMRGRTERGQQPAIAQPESQPSRFRKQAS